MLYNHGGICLFYVTTVGACEVPLPKYTTLEVLAVYVCGAQRNVLLIILYRPGSDDPTNEFINEFADILERTSTFSSSFVILGDVNVHLDEVNNPHTVAFESLLGQHGLVQHVTSPTQRSGHTLDVVIPRHDCPASAVHVEPPTLSDHSFITTEIDLRLGHGRPANIIRRRQWRNVDYDALNDDLVRSPLLTSPPSDAAGLFACYDDTLRLLVDKHAPFADVKIHAHPNAPWYDNKCRVEKSKTRRLERSYRGDKTEAKLAAWRSQTGYLRYFLRERYIHYW